MTFDRRSLLAAGFGAGLGASLGAGLGAGIGDGIAAHAGSSRPGTSGPRGVRLAATTDGPAPRLAPGASSDQTAVLQSLVDRAAATGEPVLLPPGTFALTTLVLRSGTRLAGAGAATVLLATEGHPLVVAEGAHDIAIERLVLDGAHLPPAGGDPMGLVTLDGCRNFSLAAVEIRNSGGHGLLARRGTGAITGCRIAFAADAGIHALDTTAVRIAMNEVTDCGNNGIQVWQGRTAEDGAIIHANHVARVRADGGGTGQNGNGINVYRAAGVSVSANRVTDCAYSAIRGNAASNLRVTGNTCERVGEVALYAEFGFEGALIADNLVDGAATGISITNFNDGGRLAVVQGNLIRNLVRREHEPVDKRGEGIAVEADATVTGNTIEGAPTAGIVVGWGKFMRDCVVSGNLVRRSRAGILVSADPEAGAVLVTANMISDAKDGAIRAHSLGRPLGPELAATTTDTPRIRIMGNMAV